jgi:hypothetical protein
MADEKRTDDVEKFLAEEKAFEDRKQGLVDELLRQKAEAMKAFDDKLAKLGYHAGARPRRSHHKQAAGDGAKAKPKA